MLYDSFDRTNALRVGVSNEFGGVPFTGLKTGTYYITETKAPNGYTINDMINESVGNDFDVDSYLRDITKKFMLN